eukprot:NODE_122_length_3182_cov_37.183211_g112_i0.p1 GENE.NODE_122_length_3182_cov_37.183211_g112_i0~~NODE_122_length_3182_cov_37.183211_g112_i0.p1  ORF type:complete len:1014 (+),score=210.46 NODE_122_length_3182_cov_37.183211_g112_i0:59-3100(+)
MDFQAHSHSDAECLQHFGVTTEGGLSVEQIKIQREKFGMNELEKEEPTPLWQLILDQFKDKLVLILLGSALLSFVLAFFEEHGEITAFVEPFVILLILVLNAIVGVWQEHNAENALEALKELQSTHARVHRGGQLVTIDARELLPGDVAEIRVGDKVPADCRLLKLKTTTFRTDEGSLTGESATVLKHTDPVSSSAKIQDKKNMIFAGTTVSGGVSLALVINIGMKTEIGRIQQDVQAAKEDEEKTPLGQKLDAFGDLLAKIIALICLLVWVMNYNQFSDPIHGGFFRGMIYYLKIAVALGVAAIPEGLPAVITLCLALGTRKMVKRNAIVRKLPSVETLGCCTVICSDKTGTLTTNQMTVVSVVQVGTKASHLKEFVVEGNSYAPEGKIVGFEGVMENAKNLHEFARVCSLCNEATITFQDGKYERIGEPTEAALKCLVEKMGAPGLASPANKAESCRLANDFWSRGAQKVATLEFSRDRKSMSVLVRQASKNALYCKGAPESVVPRCTHVRLHDGTVVELTDSDREYILRQVNAMSKRPLRCLAMATKLDLGALGDCDGPHHPAFKQLTFPEKFASIESGMCFVGLVGIKDPARPEVKGAIEECFAAGVRVIMITGDNKETAEAIARDIGIFDRSEDISRKSFTGAEFFSHPEAERRRLLMEGGGCRVFSRTEPRDKQALVKLLREEDEVPAMTGDGVNDAPALKQAAIGVAMGIAGTEVAKEASDMILSDDNFATIVHAIEEGRAIYSNMKAFIRYLISSNIGEVASIFLTALLGIPEGLIPVQLLWVNLVTDGPPATALGFNPPDADIMRRPPRRKDDQLIGPWVFFRYMVIGIYVGLATVGVFVYWFLVDYAEDGHPTVSWHQLSNWSECPDWTDFKVPNYGGHDYSSNPCLFFSEGKKVASTLSLSVLVTIEMFNAFNALSEDGSLLQMPPWKNPYLLLATIVSFALHGLILYTPILATIFSIAPLTWKDWEIVLLASFPVILIDEILKLVGRRLAEKERQARKKRV